MSPTTPKKVRVAKYDAEHCARCNEKVSAGQLVEAYRVPGAEWVRWVHCDCVFADGFVDLGPDGVRSQKQWSDDGTEKSDIAKAVSDASDSVASAVSKIPSAATGSDIKDAIETVAKSIVGKVLEQTLPDAVHRVVSEKAENLAATIGSNLRTKVLNETKAELSSQIERLFKETQTSLESQISSEIGAIPIKTIHVVQADGIIETRTGEVYHEKLADVVDLLTCNPRKHVFMPGPTGCGKSHLGEQISIVMKLPFYFISATSGMSEVHLLGRCIPNLHTGATRYEGTPFQAAYETGGVFLLDEADAADSNVMLILNCALANRHCSLPNRIENSVMHKHKDFCCIITANTYGRGADRLYVGRNQLDEATLDRFRVGVIPLNYSEAIERHLCPDKKLFDVFRGWRHRIEINGLRRVMSTRFMADAHDMHTQKNWPLTKIADAFFSGWTQEEVAKVKVAI